MELYRELAALRCFSHKDFVKLAGSESAAKWHIRKLSGESWNEEKQGSTE